MLILNSMSHVCSICNKEFETGHQLGSHVRSHTRKLVECESCGLRYGEKLIERHTKLCLQKGTCKLCGISTKISNTYCSKSCSNKSRKMSEETKEKIRNSILLTSKKFGNCKHCGERIEHTPKKRKRIVCYPLCDAGKKFKSDCLSKAMKGKTGGIRKGGGRGKGEYYKGIWMDSTWEIEMAKKLDSLSLNWERDTGRHKFSYIDMKGNERFYYPDFYLPDLCLYLEVKGYWTSETKHKMNDVIKRHEHVKFIVLESLEEIQNFAGVPE